MRTLIGERGLGDRVRLPGFVTDDTLASLYTGASIVVNPSLAEGFGLPAVEAAACGAPLLLSDLEAHRETMDGAALFFPPRDSVALAEFMGQILDDPELGEHLGRQARAAVAGRTWDAAAERVRELLAEAVG